nr:immunoglobulin light chain junction region [Macaca mulatta]
DYYCQVWESRNNYVF